MKTTTLTQSESIREKFSLWYYAKYGEDASGGKKHRAFAAWIESRKEVEQELAAALEKVARWIPVSERSPTHEDADVEGKVFWLHEPTEYHYCDPWDDPSDSTHWMRIPTLVQGE